MTKRIVFWVLLSLPAIAVILFVTLAPHGKGRESLDPFMGLIEESTENLNRVGRHAAPLTDAEEAEIGAELARDFASAYPPLAESDPRSRYVAAVGATVAPFAGRRLHYRFHVVPTTERNAYSLPGGWIYVTTGMLAAIECEAELAAVIGHETAHVDLRHCADKIRYTRGMQEEAPGLARAVGLLQDFIERGYSEKHEEAADRHGALLAARALYDPRMLSVFFAKMSDSAEAPRGPGETGHRPLAEIVKEASTRYEATHPGFLRRLDLADRLIDERRTEWASRSFYVGRENLKTLTPRSAREIPSEWRPIER